MVTLSLCDASGKVQESPWLGCLGEKISDYSPFQPQDIETEIICFPERSHNLLSNLPDEIGHSASKSK